MRHPIDADSGRLRPCAAARGAGRVGRRCTRHPPLPLLGLARSPRRPVGSPRARIASRRRPATPDARNRGPGGPACRAYVPTARAAAATPARARPRPCRARRGAAPTWTDSAAWHRPRALRWARAAARRRPAGATLRRLPRSCSVGRRRGRPPVQIETCRRVGLLPSPAPKQVRNFQ